MSLKVIQNNSKKKLEIQSGKTMQVIANTALISMVSIRSICGHSIIHITEKYTSRSAHNKENKSAD